MKILVTGGLGFIGCNLVNRLCKSSHVIVIDKDINRLYVKQLFNDNVDIIISDVKDINLEELSNIDIIYHLASPADPTKFKHVVNDIIAANIYFTQQVIEYCTKHNTKLIYTSSSEIYGSHAYSVSIDTPSILTLTDRSIYGSSKFTTECMIYNSNTDYVIVRLFNVYGPYCDITGYDHRLIPQLIYSYLSKDKKFTIKNRNHVRSFAYIDDVVNALVTIGVNDSFNKRAVNIGNVNQVYTIESVVSLFEKVFEVNFEKTYITTSNDVVIRSLDESSFVCNTTLEHGLKQIRSLLDKNDWIYM